MTIIHLGANIVLPEEIKKVLYDVIGVGENGEYKEDARNADEFDF